MITLPLQSRRVIVKLGTGILTSGIGQLNTDRIASLCRQLAGLRENGVRVIVVSSGAVGLGMGKLGLEKRPRDIDRLQACAAVGQSILIQTWQRHFEPFGITVGQLLLTRDDLRARKRHLTARATFDRLLEDGVVPIVNENDSVSAEEIDLKFGDNDVLSAMVASLTRADYLVILSTAPGLINHGDGGKIIPVVKKIDAAITRLATGTTSATAVGGMITKLEAARIANRSGCGAFIAGGAEPEVLPRIFSGEPVGTFFVPHGVPLESKKRWLAFFERPCGTVVVDAGARDALTGKGGSLLARGITDVTGDFSTGQLVNVATGDGRVFARGIACFSSDEIRGVRLKDKSSMQALYPARKHLEVIHRDSLVILH